MSEIKTYEIGGKTYEQRELVLGQWKQLRELVETLDLPASGSALGGLITALEEEGTLERSLAVILTPEGESPREKDLAAVAAALEFDITPQQIAEVINDFFDCNPASSILSQLGGAVLRLSALMVEGMKQIGSSPFASSLPGATSPEGRTSSGDGPSESAPPGSGTENGS